MADLRARLQPGLADRYRLERELGRGGMATVFLAHDLKHDRPVALKVLHPELAATLGPERFQREIHLAARLQHPHILTVLDSGESGGQLWFTMPFVEGESLRDRLVREGQLPVENAIRIASEAARGLEYAHAHGVVHRDIKPENILLTADGSTLVADFGIARALGGDERLTETGMTVGTPAYMSPEQSAGESNLGPRSDVYSLGCVLYEMLAGEPPFTGPSVQALMMRRLTENPRPLREQRETVPPAVEQAVLRALARAPADRFATAAQFAQALQVTPTPVGTPTVALPSSPPPATARRRPPVAALSLGLGFLIGIGALFAWRQSHPSDAGTGATRRMAVLPFENVGQAADEYFADGVSDAVRGKLAALPGLEVTARSSAGEYRRTAKPVEEVARELGVDYVLTGRVRWARDSAGSSRVEVSPELVEIEPGRPAKVRWQQPFVASITDVFQVQADVAARVASALGVAMAAETRARLEERPTASLAAYDAYLRARSYEERARLNVEPQTMEIARRMYGEAIAADSGFTLAWARLAQVYLYLYERDRTDSTLGVSARTAAEKAVALAPGSAEAHTAMGDYLSETAGDRRAALAEYERALRSDPDNPELLNSVALSQYYRGQLDSTVTTSERAAALDPRSAERSLRLGYAYRAVRRYGEAVAAFDRAIALAPDQYHAYWDKAVVLLLWKGDVDAARRTLQDAEARIGKVEFVKKMCVQCFDWTGPLAPEYEHILDQLALDGFSARDSANYYNARASRAFMRGDRAATRTYTDSARTIAERFVRERPDVPQYRFRLAGVYAASGRSDDARREYLRYAQLRQERGDTLWIGTEAALDMAYMLVWAGRRDEALDSLAHGLADTTYPYYSVQELRVDPFWAWARDDQRFRRMTGAAAPTT